MKDFSLRFFFGTPFAGYRERILNQGGPDFKPPAFFLWRADMKRPRQIISLSGDDFRHPDPLGLKPGQLLHHLSHILCSDYYRPFTTPSLFSKLFPGEHFQVESSRIKVRQAILRLRKVMTHAGWKDGLVSRGEGYAIRPSNGFAVKISDQKANGPSSRLLSFARTRNLGFSRRDLEQVLGLPCRSAQRLLKEAVDRLLIEQTSSWGSQ